MVSFIVGSAFVLGLIVGSFLNVLVLRLHTGRSTAGRSGCMSCQAQLRWWELLPVVSFVVLRGRCATCGSRIAYQYWIVELATGIAFAAIVLQPWSYVEMAFAAVLASIALALVAYDIRHTILPNELVYTFGAVALAAHVPFALTLSAGAAGHYALVVLVSGAVVALPLLLLFVLSRGAWMGFGDVKLALGIGWVLGVSGGFVALVTAFLVGAVVGVVLVYGPRVVKALSLSASSRRFTMKSEIPFAPFLVLGFFLVLLWGEELVRWFEILAL